MSHPIKEQFELHLNFGRNGWNNFCHFFKCRLLDLLLKALRRRPSWWETLCVTEEQPSWHTGLPSAKLWALPNLGECVCSDPYFTSIRNSYLNIPWVCTFWIIKASGCINYTNLGKWSNSCKVVIFKEKTFQHIDGELVSGVHRFPVMSCHGKSPSVSFKRWRTHYARY